MENKSSAGCTRTHRQTDKGTSQWCERNFSSARSLHSVAVHFIALRAEALHQWRRAARANKMIAGQPER